MLAYAVQDSVSLLYVFSFILPCLYLAKRACIHFCLVFIRFYDRYNVTSELALLLTVRQKFMRLDIIYLLQIGFAKTVVCQAP